MVGGGYSGLIAAERLSLSLGGEKILVLERCDRVGKKILSTGNGRGNVSNVDLSPAHYHSEEGVPPVGCVARFGGDAVAEYYSSIGLLLSEENGRLYPSSFQASSVLDVLRLRLASLGTVVRTGEKCLDISRCDGCFVLKTASGEYRADKVVLCCGGKASPNFGTDGTSYALAEKFGHTVTALLPSLVQIKTERAPLKGLKGIKLTADVGVYDGTEMLAKTRGDVLFTDYGVSGNTAFYLSSYITGRAGCTLKLSFLPDKSEREISDYLAYKLKIGYFGRDDLLTGIINKQVGRAILTRVGTDLSSADAPKRIARVIKGFTLAAEGVAGFDGAQVTRGGIRCAEVDDVTFESKLRKGLYIVGEMLDVDGDCGGYNLQFAFSSALSAAEGIINETRQG